MGRGLIRKWFVIFLTVSLASPQVWAQEEDDLGADESAVASPTTGKSKKFAGPRKQLAVIILAGLGGAVLGLSTLSFYGRPQDYLASIAVGFAVGIIIGTIYVTYKAATNPQEFYGGGKQRTSYLLNPSMPQAPPTPEGLALNYRFEF